MPLSRKACQAFFFKLHGFLALPVGGLLRGVANDLLLFGERLSHFFLVHQQNVHGIVVLGNPWHA